MAVYDALELTMIDDKQVEYVRAREGKSIEQELRSFISRSHGYESGWIKVHGEDEDRYVRYDRIASVRVVRGLDDEQPPMVALG
jgi:transcriptional antiterminator Rof (Rho-off)